jgi:hypothetical protein
MPDLLAGARGEDLKLDDYLTDFERDFASMEQPGFWKLERQQFFREPGNESWEAFARGDWSEALRLIESDRHELLDYHRDVARRGLPVCRVRVVELPINPYLQWELHALRLRDEAGGPIRVVEPDRVADLEPDGPLPEVATLGTRVAYQAVYNEQAALTGGRRFTDPSLVNRCQQLTQRLFDAGEPIESFFAREVAHLPPPRPTG